MNRPEANQDKESTKADKPLYVLHGTIKTPPMSSAARLEVGFHLRRIQQGELLAMPVSRPMPTIGANCHELRISDGERNTEWRIIYCIDSVAILVLEVLRKRRVRHLNL
jgi:hypothetical protein